MQENTIEKTINEIFNLIKKENSRESIDAIPHSNEFTKHTQALTGISETDLKIIIDILKEAHKIFIFEIAKEDRDREIKKIEGYVEADLQTISRLKHYYQSKLMEEFEQKFNKRLLVHQIVKEIFPKLHLINNSQLGFIANKAIMLEEFENLINKEYMEYTENWKDEKLNQIIEENKNILLKDKKTSDSEKIEAQKLAEKQRASRRAIDSDEYKSFAQKQHKDSIKKLLQIYGVDFFYRVHLRKYDFETLINAVELHEIEMKDDLKKLKELIKKIKMNYITDPELKKYSEEIHHLERVIAKNMVSTHH